MKFLSFEALQWMSKHYKAINWWRHDNQQIIRRHLRYFFIKPFHSVRSRNMSRYICFVLLNESVHQQSLTEYYTVCITNIKDQSINLKHLFYHRWQLSLAYEDIVAPDQAVHPPSLMSLSQMTKDDFSHDVSQIC